MAFCFKRRESVQKAIRRLGRERIENALECLKDCGRVEAVHCARKDIKKVRAILRLVRTAIAKKAFCRLTKLSREAAKQLAVLRDAYIRAKALHDLAHHFKGQLAPGALRHVRTELRHGFEEEMKRFGKERTARAVERRLHRVGKEMERLDVGGKGWKALGPGVKRAYSEGRRVYRTMRKDASPENFHAWRKRAKDLWYQVTLLHPVWPEQMDAMARELEGLGEYLGNDHDLVVLRQAVEEQCTGDGNERELETLNGLIEQRQRELRAAALALGARFYAEKPSIFCNRLAGYWQIWRREPKPAARTFEAML
jgi:CHAD domain-containing protein